MNYFKGILTVIKYFEIFWKKEKTKQCNVITRQRQPRKVFFFIKSLEEKKGF